MTEQKGICDEDFARLLSGADAKTAFPLMEGVVPRLGNEFILWESVQAALKELMMYHAFGSLVEPDADKRHAIEIVVAWGMGYCAGLDAEGKHSADG